MHERDVLGVLPSLGMSNPFYRGITMRQAQRGA